MRTRLLVVSLSLIACGGEAAPSPETTATAAPPEVAFVARDNVFEGPDSLEAGLVTLVLRNEGPEWHHLQLVRLPDDLSMDEFRAALSQMQPGTPPPPWWEDAGGVNPPEAGEEARVTLHLREGEYAVLCLVDTPDRVPHFAKGMISSLTVTPAQDPPAPEPAADLTLTLVDYGFSFSEPPTAGQRMIRVENEAPQGHEIALFRLRPGKTIDDFAAWGEAYEGESPVTAVGGVPAMAPGTVAWMHAELAPGDYVAACFVPDATDGRMHLEHGMIMPFSVT